jgi:hypothetical protein
MACGGCGKRREVKAADGSVMVTRYVVTWGDGSTAQFDDTVAARMAMAKEESPTKRRGMRVAPTRVKK